MYTRPERQNDLLVFRDRLTDLFAGKHVLEVAAGTGWWTSVFADKAGSVTATDVDQAMLPWRDEMNRATRIDRPR